MGAEAALHNAYKQFGAKMNRVQQSILQLTRAMIETAPQYHGAKQRLLDLVRLLTLRDRSLRQFHNADNLSRTFR